MHSLCPPTTLPIIRVHTKPPNKKDVHSGLGCEICCPGDPLSNHKVIYADYSCVPVRKCRFVVLVGEDHDVWMGPGVGQLFQSLCVVCRRHEPDGLVFVYSIVIDDDNVTIGVCEVMFVAGERQPLDACQQVVKQATGKVLSERWASVLCDSGYGIDLLGERNPPASL